MNEDELYVATEDPKLSLKTTEGENYTASDLTAQKCCWPKGSWREKPEWRSKKASGGRTLSLHLACEQALLFGRPTLAARERASERRSLEGPRGLSLPYLRL